MLDRPPGQGALTSGVSFALVDDPPPSPSPHILSWHAAAPSPQSAFPAPMSTHHDAAPGHLEAAQPFQVGNDLMR